MIDKDIHIDEEREGDYGAEEDNLKHENTTL